MGFYGRMPAILRIDLDNRKSCHVHQKNSTFNEKRRKQNPHNNLTEKKKLHLELWTYREILQFENIFMILFHAKLNKYTSDKQSTDKE